MREIAISQNLKTLLSDNQKTSKELAEYLDVSASLISSYLTKNTLPPIDKLIKISFFLDVTIDDIIFRKNKNEFNLISEPKIEYGSNSIKKNKCVLTGGDCSFREMDVLRLDNERLRKELEKLKGK